MEQQEKQLPIGKAKELEAKKETLPAVEVKNHVIYLNPAFPELPFDFEEGKQTKLGMFLTPEPKEKFYPLEVRALHERSGLLGRVIFKDREGRIYRDIDLKGVGYVLHKPEESWLASRDVPRGDIPLVAAVGRIHPKIDKIIDQRKTMGVLDRVAAMEDAEKAELFLSYGMRVSRTVGRIALEELIDDKGKKVSIETAKNRGLIWPESEPEIEVRAFGTKFRLSDARDPLVIDDARKLVAEELGIHHEDFDYEKYVDWLAGAIGKNLGLLHRNGWSHGYVTDHNITLDGRLVDFDSADPGGDRDDFEEDTKQARFAIRVFLQKQGKISMEEKELGLFRVAYDSAMVRSVAADSAITSK